MEQKHATPELEEHELLAARDGVSREDLDDARRSPATGKRGRAPP
jgi:hypothetical protein